MIRNSINIPLLFATLVLLGCDAQHPTPTTVEKAPSQETESEEVASLTPPPLIDRTVLFGNPMRFQGRLSPDGKKMSFRAPLDGVMNIWVGDSGDFDSVRPITNDTGRGIPSHFWALDSEHVLYTRDEGGDENWHLFSVDLASGEITDLTPYEGVQAQMVAQSERVPGVVVVGMNDRDPKWHDLYKVDLGTGERQLLVENNGFASFVVDNDLNVRLASEPTISGGFKILGSSDGEWKLLFEVPFEDAQTSSVLGFDEQNRGVYMLDSRERDTSALVHLDLSDMTVKTIAESEGVDVSSVIIHPRSHEPIAYALDLIRPVYHALSIDFVETIDRLNSQLTGGSQVLAQSLDNRYWTVYTDESDRSPVYKVFDTTTGALDELFVTNPTLNDFTLAKMHGVIIESRDGKDLVSYLTLPSESDPDGDGLPTAPVPLVMLVHGGPWGRDTYGYAPTVQWLANRGIGVLQVNFRSSTGFGKAFLNAGNEEWAGAMHNDLLDAKKWAVEQGVTQADQVAIMGGSYGGYATLVGLSFTPEEFSCGVDIVGPSNLVTLMESIPPYWESFRKIFARAIGDLETEKGLSLLKERSPLARVDQITKPLLIGQGANDPRVKQAESDQIVDAMKSNNIPVTYVLYPDEGHGFQKPENSLSFFAVAEAFLAECLGGRYQEIGSDFTDSSIQVPHGVEYVEGLETRLSSD
ncbi:MAG: S9 family peptidase [Xanthomonadales bacterium]|nr:S9 family peptidase [Gammaproteobacteria bacterium]NND56815.1 S9 family peptidase [Xanthomonadales bacterium]NNK50083.1 S9 family peptidase [Xanthomonadales bacterium]